MITDLDRATRTLIISFTIAIMALIPLRFIEVGQNMMMASDVQVLGDYSEQVILPQEAVVEEMGEEGMLEAPYNEIDGQVLIEEEPINNECISRADAEVIMAEMDNRILNVEMTTEQMDQLIFEIESINNSICR